MKKKLSLFDYFHIVAFIMFTTFTALFIFLSYTNAQTKFERESQKLSESYLDSKKKMLHDEVTKFVDFIHSKKRDVYHKTQDTVKERVLEAYALALSIHERHKNTHTPTQIQEIIIETLRHLRFENGKGYYFITRLDGIEMLFADKPEMEGKNMLGLRNHEGRFVVKGMIDVVKAQKEGFYEYSWTKPQADGEHFKKISYIKLFEPYDWFIGTGLYLDDMEHKVKEEILNDTERLLFDKEGKNYIFAGTWKGMSLSHPAKGKDMYNVKDVNGKYIVQELISRARSGGGFVEYVMPPLKGERNLNKLSYVAGILDWEWYVGAGMNGTYLSQNF